MFNVTEIVNIEFAYELAQDSYATPPAGSGSPPAAEWPPAERSQPSCATT